MCFLLLLSFGDHHSEKSIQMHSCLSGESRYKRGTDPFIKTMQRCAHETAYAVRRGRFNAAFFAVCIYRGNEGLLLALLCELFLAESCNQCFLILGGSLMKAKKRTNSSAMRFNHTLFPIVGNDLLRGHSQLLGQTDNYSGGEYRVFGRESGPHTENT